MSSRDYECGRRQRHKESGRCSSFFSDWLTGDATTALCLSEPSFDEVRSDDELIRKVKDYTGAGKEERYFQPHTTKSDRPSSHFTFFPHWAPSFLPMRAPRLVV